MNVRSDPIKPNIYKFIVDKDKNHDNANGEWRPCSIMTSSNVARYASSTALLRGYASIAN